MAWDFLRRFLKLMGGKFITRLAPRLIFFQYYDRISLELQEQKKKYRLLFYRSPAQLMILNLLTNKTQNSNMGISSILHQNKDNDSEVSILQVNSNEDFWDSKTVSSHYEYDASQQDFQFIELQASYVQDV